MLPQGEVSKKVPLSCANRRRALHQKVSNAFAKQNGVSIRRLDVARNEASGRGRALLAVRSEADSIPCAAHSSSRATTVSLGLIECLAPVGQKLSDEGMFLIRLHGQRGQCEGDSE
jgi:hypothetical protein